MGWKLQAVLAPKGLQSKILKLQSACEYNLSVAVLKLLNAELLLQRMTIYALMEKE